MRRVAAIAVLLLIGQIAFSTEVDDIITKAEAAFTQTSIYSKSTMEILSGDQVRRSMQMISYSIVEDGRSKSLMIFTDPARMAGTAYLTVGNDVWVRFGSTGRVRKLSSSSRGDSAAGDFSYADLGEGSGGVSGNYSPRMIDRNARVDGTAAYQIELTPTGADDPYDRLVVWIAHDTYRYLVIDYYEDGAQTKTMTLTDYRTVDGVDYPYTVTMSSVVRDSSTRIITDRIDFDSELVKPELFTQAYLESMN